jgi:hypothetical protein
MNATPEERTRVVALTEDAQNQVEVNIGIASISINDTYLYRGDSAWSYADALTSGKRPICSPLDFSHCASSTTGHLPADRIFAHYHFSTNL